MWTICYMNNSLWTKYRMQHKWWKKNAVRWPVLDERLINQIYHNVEGPLLQRIWLTKGVQQGVLSVCLSVIELVI